MMTTWRELITQRITENNDSWDNVVHSTLTNEEYDEEFDNGYGGEEGRPFTLWTKDFVYFPLCYDGAEWVGSAPRNPCNIKLEHQGGG